MRGGARTPEELETLLEDTLVLRDPEALAQLFETGAMLALGGGPRQARGRREITRVATRAWDLKRSYLADPERVLQVRDTALVLGRRAINVARRGGDGSWRYIIALLDLEPEVTVHETRGAKMPILRIEHPVPDFGAWKDSFDSDPVGRERSGVRRYRVLRPVDDPNYAMVDLEFGSSSEAEAFRAALLGLWRRVEAEGLIASPQARIVEAVESKDY